MISRAYYRSLSHRRKDASTWFLTSGHNVRALSSSSSAAAEPEYFDVLIVGGGAVGCSMARTINATSPQLKVGLMEARDAPPPSLPKDSDESSRVPHPRSYALSPNSLQLLGDNVTSKLSLGYYESMQVWQAKSPASLTFTTRDLHADPSKAPFLGACVEDGPLVSALWEEIQDSTKCWTQTTLDSIDSVGGTHSLAQVTTKDGKKVQAAVLIGADGGNSWVRRTLGVSRVGTEYDQHALTFTVKIDSSLRKRAFQRFLADGGPMALLPTFSPDHAVIVWSTSPETVRKWKDESSSNDELVNLLNESLMEGAQRIPPLVERPINNDESSSMFGTVASNLLYGAERVVDTVHYGMAMASHYPIPKTISPPSISEIVSPKFSFPLSTFQSRSYVKGRVALIGDAAHTVHPMAGQGLNLGLGDVRVLVASIEKASMAGMDASTFLNEYASDRQRNVSLSLGGIHTLQRLFGSQNVALLHAKTLGMNVIQNLGPLRRQLAIAATHGVSI
jgi:ubiquinone biosynthesis monooxygenase Coq6